MREGEKTTIWVDIDVRDELNRLKVIEQEPVNDVVRKLLKFYKMSGEEALPKLEQVA